MSHDKYLICQDADLLIGKKQDGFYCSCPIKQNHAFLYTSHEYTALATAFSRHYEEHVHYNHQTNSIAV